MSLTSEQQPSWTHLLLHTSSSVLYLVFNTYKMLIKNNVYNLLALSLAMIPESWVQELCCCYISWGWVLHDLYILSIFSLL